MTLDDAQAYAGVIRSLRYRWPAAEPRTAERAVLVLDDAVRAADTRLETLASMLLQEFGDRGPKDEGAIEMAIRVLRELKAELAALTKKMNTCPTCDQTGLMSVVVAVHSPDGREEYVEELCAECEGTGISYMGRLIADQRDWRKGVELIALALGEPDSPNLSCVRLAEIALQQRVDLAAAQQESERLFTLYAQTGVERGAAMQRADNAEREREKTEADLATAAGLLREVAACGESCAETTWYQIFMPRVIWTRIQAWAEAHGGTDA